MNNRGELTPGEMPDLIFTLVPPSKETPLDITREGVLVVIDPGMYHIVRDILIRGQTRETMIRESIELAAKLAIQDQANIPDNKWDGKTWTPDGESQEEEEEEPKEET